MAHRSPLYLHIVEGLPAEALFPECAGTLCNKAGGGASGEDVVNTRYFLMVATWADDEWYVK